MARPRRLLEPRVPTTFFSPVAIRSAIDDIVQVGGLGVADTICAALTHYVTHTYPGIAAKHGLAPANG